MTNSTERVTVRNVHISKQYGDDDRYTASVGLQTPTGEINLKIPEERVNEIVEMVADLVVQATGEAMQAMTRAAMKHVAISHDPEGELPESDAEATSEETA